MDDLSKFTTFALLAELVERGVDLQDLQWEECGECFRMEGFDEKTGRCGAGIKPIWFMNGLRGDCDPHTVGFYTINCEKRIVPRGARNCDSGSQFPDA